MISISVIIPTYNRKETILRCLHRYAEQTFPSDRFEVVVVDDGSTDGTWELLDKLQGKFECRLSCYWQKNGGPGTARNLGIRKAAGEVLLIVGDDIFPDCNLLSEHYSWHTDQFPEENMGVLGFVTWDRDPPPSPFMIWLERGYQNAYHLIRHREEVGWRFSYTGNISLKRGFLEKAQGYFDETTLKYGYEDIEWGFRLHREGFRLFYNENAIGYHRHWQTLDESLHRVERVGRSARALRKLNREAYDSIMKDMLFDSGWKSLVRKVLTKPFLARRIVLPMAKYLEHRRINSYIFALSHLYFFERGLSGSEPTHTE